METFDNADIIVVIDGKTYHKIQLKFIAQTSKKLSEYIEDLELDIDQLKLKLLYKEQIIAEQKDKINSLQKTAILVQELNTAHNQKKLEKQKPNTELEHVFNKLKKKHDEVVWKKMELNVKVVDLNKTIKNLLHYQGAYSALYGFLIKAGISKQSIDNTIMQETKKVLKLKELENQFTFFAEGKKSEKLQVTINKLQQLIEQNSTNNTIKALKFIIRQYGLEDAVINQFVEKFDYTIQAAQNYIEVNENYSVDAKAEITMLQKELDKVYALYHKQLDVNAKYKTLVNYNTKLLNKNEDLEKTIYKLITELEVVKKSFKQDELIAEYLALKNELSKQSLEKFDTNNTIVLQETVIKNLKSLLKETIAEYEKEITELASKKTIGN